MREDTWHVPLVKIPRYWSSSKVPVERKTYTHPLQYTRLTLLPNGRLEEVQTTDNIGSIVGQRSVLHQDALPSTAYLWVFSMTIPSYDSCQIMQIFINYYQAKITTSYQSLEGLVTSENTPELDLWQHARSQHGRSPLPCPRLPQPDPLPHWRSP